MATCLELPEKTLREQLPLQYSFFLNVYHSFIQNSYLSSLFFTQALWHLFSPWYALLHMYRSNAMQNVMFVATVHPSIHLLKAWIGFTGVQLWKRWSNGFWWTIRVVKATQLITLDQLYVEWEYMATNIIALSSLAKLVYRSTHVVPQRLMLCKIPLQLKEFLHSTRYANVRVTSTCTE
jgi:hypothetical protein